MAKSAICIADSSAGIYIPQYFAGSIRKDWWKYVDSDDLDILLSGPDHESYWDAWDSVLNNAETLDGRVLWQDGDLWVIDADSARLEIDEYCQTRLEYEESHKDAGDAYSHMPSESWTSTEESNLAKYIADKGIQTHGMGIDDIGNIVLDNFRMYTGNIYGPNDLDDSAFILAAYPVQEIEIDLSNLGMDGVTFEYVKDSCNAYIRGDMAYLTTDAVWYAAITKESLQSAINAAIN